MGRSRFHIVRACEASLRRLKTDRIDVYYLHRHDPRTSLEEALHGLEQLVRDGKILLKRQVEVELLPMAQANAIGVLPYSPLAADILSGKYLDDTAGTGRMTSSKSYQARYAQDDKQETVKRFVAIASRLGVSPVALAIAWVAHHPGVTAPVLGAPTRAGRRRH